MIAVTGTGRGWRAPGAVGNERGIALLAVVGIVLALLPVAVAVTVEARLDLLVQRNARSANDAFYAAEAGLAHVLAELGPSVDVRDLLRGPDRIAGTADDGSFPFALFTPADFALGAIGYEIALQAGPQGAVRVVSRGRAAHGAVREVEMLLRPAAEPFSPAALYVEAEELEIDLGSGALAISGIPRLEVSAAIAGLAVPSPAAAAALRAVLVPAAAVTGAGSFPSVAASRRLELGAHAAALAGRADAVLQPPPGTAEGVVLGTPEAPRLSVIAGHWSLAGDVGGCGILVVRGDLAISGRLHYRGLVIVEGALSVPGEGGVEVEGGLWTAAPAAGPLLLAGAGAIRYEPSILRAVDAAIPAALPRLPVVGAWREVS